MKNVAVTFSVPKSIYEWPLILPNLSMRRYYNQGSLYSICIYMHFKQVFFIWGTKKMVAGCVRQLVFLYRNDCMASKLIVLDERSSYRDGRFSRFDYTWSSVSSDWHKYETSSSRQGNFTKPSYKCCWVVEQSPKTF